MAELNKNAIKLSQMFDMDINKVKKLYDIIGLSDLAALTTAINSDDMKTTKSIVSKYQSKLVDLPDAKEVQNFYYDQISIEARNENEALADTADHFGITGEQVQQMLEAPKVAETAPFIPDSHVQAAYNNVQEMLKGGKTQMLLCALNPWQRRMFYGLVPATVSAVCQKTLDLTPIAIMQKQAEIEGVAEVSVQENTASLHDMIENIIQYELNRLSEAVETVQGPKHGPWDLKWTAKKDSKTQKYMGVAYNTKARRDAPGSRIEVQADNINEFPQALLSAIEKEAGSQVIEMGDKVTVDFNSLLRDNVLHGHGGELFADVLPVNGKPTLILSKTDLGGMKRATDRSALKSRTPTSKGLQSFNLPAKDAIKAGLHNARYTVGDAIDYVEGADAYPLILASKVIAGQPEKHDDAGVTVAVIKNNATHESTDLIKSIVSKKF